MVKFCIQLSLVGFICAASSQALAVTYDLGGKTAGIIISGVNGTVELRESDQSLTSQVQIIGAKEAGSQEGDGKWLLEKTEEKGIVVFHFKSMYEAEKGNASSLKVIILGKAVPVEVFMQQGSILSSKWSQNMKFVLIDGNINLQNTRGNLFVDQKRGNLTLQNHDGALKIDSYSTNLTLKKIKGPLTIENFIGESQIQNVEGTVEIRAFQGQTRLNVGKGSLKFENGRRHLIISSYSGQIDGHSEEGDVDLDLIDEEQVKIYSVTGKVKIQTASGSGAKVNLESAEGDIFVPKFLAVTRTANMRSVNGKLSGKRSGRIFVRTEQAQIILK